MKEKKQSGKVKFKLYIVYSATIRRKKKEEKMKSQWRFIWLSTASRFFRLAQVVNKKA